MATMSPTVRWQTLFYRRVKRNIPSQSETYQTGSPRRATSHSLLPTQHLPHEILGDIFLLLSPAAVRDHNDREGVLKLGLVCKHWRWASDASKRLWSGVSLDHLILTIPVLQLGFGAQRGLRKGYSSRLSPTRPMIRKNSAAFASTGLESRRIPEQRYFLSSECSLKAFNTLT
jgi:hypothetical protein